MNSPEDLTDKWDLDCLTVEVVECSDVVWFGDLDGGDDFVDFALLGGEGGL